MPLRSSDRIVFFGDSLTEQGELPQGYVSIVREHLRKDYPGITVIGAGISGNKVPQLVERLDRDVLRHRPTIVVIYIGINDVWHFDKHGTGTPKPVYESGLRDLIARIQASSARVMLCTPSVVGEKHRGENKLDSLLDDYAGISREVAQSLGATVCDLRKEFISYLTSHNPKNLSEGILTVDSVHLNDEGNRLVAETLLSVISN